MSWSPMVIVLSALAVGPLSGQQPVALGRGRSIEATLSHGDTNRYTVTLRGRQFVYGEADQQTVDVVVTVFGPDGKRLGAFDGPARGPEPFVIHAVAAGTYRIEVTPFAQETGRYAVALRRIEPLATSPAHAVDQIMAPYSGKDRPGGVVAVTRNGAIVFASP